MVVNGAREAGDGVVQVIGDEIPPADVKTCPDVPAEAGKLKL